MERSLKWNFMLSKHYNICIKGNKKTTLSHYNNEAVCKLDANRILRDDIRYDKPIATAQLEQFGFTIVLFFVYIYTGSYKSMELFSILYVEPA